MWRFGKQTILRTALLLMMATAISSLMAQSHGLEIAPRAGVYLGKNDMLSLKTTPVLGVEADYSFTAAFAPHASAGFQIGVGITHTRLNIQGVITDRFTNYDYQGRRLDYTNTASAAESHTLYQLEFPLMGSVSYYGATLRVGPRLIRNLADRYTLTISEPKITATYADYGVSMTNRLVTGVLPTAEMQQTGTFGLPRGTLQLGTEAGYTFTLHEGRYTRQRLALLFFAYIDMVRLGGATNDIPFISVSPITSAAYPVAEVHVTNRMGNFAGNLHGVQLGLRIAYTLESIDYQQYNWHHRR